MEDSEKQRWTQNMQAANEAIKSLYSGPGCPQVIRAVVAKYLAWTEEELQEWEVGFHAERL